MENDYIINPYIFYWINVAHKLIFFTSIGCFLLITTSVIFIVDYHEEKENLEHYEEGEYGYNRTIKKMNYSLKWFKNTFIMGVVFIILTVCIPNQETCYKMLIASSLTKKNIEVSRDFIIESIDKAVDRIINKGECKK